MTKTGRYIRLGGMAGLAVLAMSAPAFAQEVEEVAEEAFALSAPDTAYVFNTLLFLMTGFLVMFMAAGFAMLEAGLVRSKNVAMQCTKNIALYSIAGIMYYLVGYNLMYSGVDGGYFGSISIWGVDDSGGVASDGSGYASASDWYFQMVFVATAASIVSGTLAERIKLWPFLVFTVFLTGVIYPIQGSWQWGGGWLSELGFADFAGSTLVHSTGGWAALMGALVLGPRIGKYVKGGGVNPMPGSSMPLATLGTFILWLGWFGFNGGSELALGSPDEANAVATIFINTNMAAAAGVVAAMLLTQLLYKKVDITMALNGALAGLVSITAEPLAPTLGWALAIGAIGGVIVVLTVPLLDKLRIDDVVGAIPVHLFCGIWGTMAVPLTNADTNFAAQATGVISIGIFVAVTSLVLWLALRFTIGIRCSEEEEMMGLDKAEIGVEAYPEFTVR
ncbi:MAG: ammonium transporter [Parvibaculum sp.]|uniref:ammonium transporter n=1 Tax=Parvibaculum sp. TaxID=2024848 RepID=UPI000CA76C87|nr:ammonium transporter [Parvibaculum sp.]MDZ4381113.1 ammonium transporter [Parvibaculum sp.]PKP77480.1 MAG: ammonium transporter [Alphaproteobacteria bacterium HGW-Alphaproteobacteria-3]